VKRKMAYVSMVGLEHTNIIFYYRIMRVSTSMNMSSVNSDSIEKDQS